MIVVSDTSPLRYLAALGGIEWLPLLFEEVVCPPEVIAECLHERAPSELRSWARSLPPWLRVVPASAGARPLDTDTLLDGGETAALLLARELKADLLLMDERKGRAVAGRLGIAVTGTLGVLVEAALRGLIDFDEVIGVLRTKTNFLADDAVIATARRRVTSTSS